MVISLIDYVEVLIMHFKSLATVFLGNKELTEVDLEDSPSTTRDTHRCMYYTSVLRKRENEMYNLT